MTTEVKPGELEFLDSLQVGDLVEHPRWGIGSVIQRTGLGERTKLVVAFPEAEGNGQKRLMARFARLRKIEDTKPEPEKTILVEEPKPEVVPEPVKPPAPAEAEAAEEEEDDEDEILAFEIDEDDHEDMPTRVREEGWKEEPERE